MKGYAVKLFTIITFIFVYFIGVSINNNSENSLSLAYPNKIGEVLNVNLTQKGAALYASAALSASVETKNTVNSTTLYRDKIDSVTIKVSNADYAENIYTLKITGPNGVVDTNNWSVVDKYKTGKTLYNWISTTEVKKIILTEGEYSLSETIAPVGYKLSTTTIEFKVDANGSVYVKNEKGNYVAVDKVVMINVLKDVVTIAKKDSKTDVLVAGATLVIKNKDGNIVKEFTTTNEYYQLTMDAGTYTIEEKSAPAGYIKSNEIITFELLDNGTLKIKDKNGDFIESNLVTFYNSKGEEVPVPATASSSTLLIIGGLVLIIGGAYCVRKTIKEC